MTPTLKIKKYNNLVKFKSKKIIDGNTGSKQTKLKVSTRIIILFSKINRVQI